MWLGCGVCTISLFHCSICCMTSVLDSIVVLLDSVYIILLLPKVNGDIVYSINSNMSKIKHIYVMYCASYVNNN